MPKKKNSCWRWCWC